MNTCNLLGDIFSLLSNVWNIIWDILALIGFSTIIKGLIDLVLTYHDLRKLENSYSQAITFIKRNLGEVSYVLSKLPEEIIVEATYKGGKTVSSRLLTALKKSVKKVRGKQYVSVVIFSDMSYPEQLAFIIKKAFDTVFPFEKVLEVEFREAILNYYAYKFAMACEKLVGRDTIEVLERDFQGTKYKDVVVRLDSKELEGRITLNPPPEVRPLLDRVIIPILELKSREMEFVSDLSTVEFVKARMGRILVAIAEGLIAVLFVGKRRPEDYICYVKERIGEFRGLLVCSRGAYTGVYEEFIHGELVRLLEESGNFTGIEIERFEGKLAAETGKEVYYRHGIFIDRDLLKP